MVDPFDLLVVGEGTAGMTAAIYAASSGRGRCAGAPRRLEVMAWAFPFSRRIS